MASFLYERGRTATTPNASQDAADVHETSRTAAPSVPGTVATGSGAPVGAYAPGWSMAGSSPDLFVVCKNCGSEVSPYITECPYCGQRLRKRAPKIERDEHGAGRPKERRQRPTLGRLRPGEMPGIKIDRDDRPVVSIALVVLGLVGLLALAVVDQSDVAVAGPVDGEWWRVLTTPFAYVNTWYQLACLATVAIFGALLEQRHGHVAVLVLWLLAASGGAAVAAVAVADPLVLGGNGGALGLLAAWAVPAVLARRANGGQDDADLLGVLVFGLVLAAMPLALDTGADPVAGTVGGLVGIAAGFGLARVRPRV